MKQFVGYRGVFLVNAALSCLGCGSAADPMSDGESPATQAAEPVVEVAGRTFLRRDLWSKADFDRILYEGRADQDGSTPEVLAAQLRGHMAVGNAYYIELEPNIELAKRILSKEPVPNTPSSEERQGRTVIGSDSRVLFGTTNAVPGTTIGFNESRGTGVRINDTTLYTAAHVVYQTQVANNWFCADGTTTAGCNRPRWRFGVNGTSAFAGWTSYNCEVITIPTAFVNLVDTSNESAWAHFDFAVVNLINCSNRGGTSWLGTWNSTDQDLLDANAHRLGYPARATCPAGANGDTGSTSNGTNVLGTDCPGTGNWPGSTYRINNTAAPYAGAQLWYSTTSDVWAGDSTSIRSTVDLTHGDSGGPLYMFAPGSSTDRRVLGVASLSPQTYNVFNRWTAETYNWFHTYATFP
ncbi:MAG TPA: hypothetical protein VHM25_14505 [Polyangiaceae bacterium]|nr:hypothetical protein [Polyangiaceae bacterium]